MRTLGDRERHLSGLDRRRFLMLAGAAALVPAAAFSLPPGTVPNSRRRMLQVNDYATDADKLPVKVPAFERSVEFEIFFFKQKTAYEMNGEPLAPLHGAPARLVVP